MEPVLTWKELSVGIPYRARVNERWFPNLPGFHGGAYVVAYVEDTSDCAPRRDPYCDDDCACCPENFEPRTILEIADWMNRVNLSFDVDSDLARENALHKLDTLGGDRPSPPRSSRSRRWIPPGSLGERCARRERTAWS